MVFVPADRSGWRMILARGRQEKSVNCRLAAVAARGGEPSLCSRIALVRLAPGIRAAWSRLLGENGDLDAGASRAGERLMLRRSPLALDLPIKLCQNPGVTESALKLVPRFKCRPCSARGLAGLGSFPTAPLHCRDRQRWRSAIVSFRRSKTGETG